MDFHQTLLVLVNLEKIGILRAHGSIMEVWSRNNNQMLFPNTPADRSDLDAGIRWGAAENIAQLGEVASPKTPFFSGFFLWEKNT